MERYLSSRELSYRLARVNFWYPSFDAGDISPRIVIPSTSRDDFNLFWQARAMDDNPKRYQSPSAPRGDALIMVYPDEVVRGVIVVEGPMDALAAAGEGFLGVALMGQTPPEEALLHLIEVVLKFKTKVRLVADKDSPEGMFLIIRRLYNLGANFNMDLMLPYPYKDLAEAPRTIRSQLLNG